MTEQLLKLPQKPGTVIAIGEWWLVRLRPYESAPSAWELLTFSSSATAERAQRLGVSSQCVYGDEWVLAEAEQEGGYVVISDPRDVPSGIQYFKHEAALATEPDDPRTWEPGTRVTLEVNDTTTWHGAIVQQLNTDEAAVRWDHEPDPLDRVFPEALEREKPPRWRGNGTPPIGARVRLISPTMKGLRGVVSAHSDSTGYTFVHWDHRDHEDGAALVQIAYLKPEREQ